MKHLHQYAAEVDAQRLGLINEFSATNIDALYNALRGHEIRWYGWQAKHSIEIYDYMLATQNQRNRKWSGLKYLLLGLAAIQELENAKAMLLAVAEPTFLQGSNYREMAASAALVYCELEGHQCALWPFDSDSPFCDE